MAWRYLIVGHLRNISTKLFENWPDTFGGEDFLCFHYSKIVPTPWRPCFSTNQHYFKESDRGSPKKHFYKIIWKSANQFGRRRNLKFFSFRCLGNQNSAWIPNIYKRILVKPLKGCFLWSFSPIDPLVTEEKKLTHAGQKAITRFPEIAIVYKLLHRVTVFIISLSH